MKAELPHPKTTESMLKTAPKRPHGNDNSLKSRIIGACEAGAGFLVVFLFSWLFWRWLILPIVRRLVDPLWLRIPTESAVAIDAACVIVLVFICWLAFEHWRSRTRAGKVQLSLKDEEEMKRFWEEVTGEPWGEESRIVKWKNKALRWIGGVLCLAAAYFTAIRPLLRACDPPPDGLTAP